MVRFMSFILFADFVFKKEHVIFLAQKNQHPVHPNRLNLICCENSIYAAMCKVSYVQQQNDGNQKCGRREKPSTQERDALMRVCRIEHSMYGWMGFVAKRMIADDGILPATSLGLALCFLHTERNE